MSDDKSRDLIPAFIYARELAVSHPNADCARVMFRVEEDGKFSTGRARLRVVFVNSAGATLDTLQGMRLTSRGGNEYVAVRRPGMLPVATVPGATDAHEPDARPDALEFLYE